MLTKIKVRNFQSLTDVELELGKFTVIVGASSSGKSAFVRALRTLISNGRGSAFITHGKTQCTIQAELEDKSVVTLLRGVDSKYQLLTPTEDLTFTKLGGTVPDQVSEALRLSSPAIHFAGQFDRPYLLDDTGSAVATELGELTNVSRIFEAVREANSRRQRTNQESKLLTEQLEALRVQMDGFMGLPVKLEDLARTEQAVKRAEGLESQVKRLTDLLQRYVIAEQVVARASTELQAMPIPDLTVIMARAARLQQYRDLVRTWLLSSRQVIDIEAQLTVVQDEAVLYEQQVHQLLEEAGVCPLCGQSTKELQSV